MKIIKTERQAGNARARLEYRNEPITLTRAQWASNCRLGLVHRIGGRRYVIGIDNQQGVRTVTPVNLIEGK
jgi:hypothetical protein